MDVRPLNSPGARWVNTAPRVTLISADALSAAEGPSPAESTKLIDSLRMLGGLSARVVESRPGNVHVLDVSGTRITLKLAQSFPAGELLAMVLGEGPETAATRENVQLSASARWLNDALQQKGDSNDTGASAPVSRDPPAETAKLAQGLREAIRDTGLFYESHLATWIDGRLSLQDIRRETKAQLGSGTAAEPSDGQDTSLPPGLAGLVRRQLESLDTRTVAWQGDLWPGQPGELSIEEDGQARGDAVPAWQTRLRLTLPRLGDIDARISLRGTSVQVQMAAGAVAADDLVAAGQGLREALSARGLQAESLLIRPHND